MHEKVKHLINLIQQNRLDAAAAAFASLLTEIYGLDDADEIARIGHQLAQLGFIDYSRQIYEAGEKLFPKQSLWPILKGELWLDAGNYEEALDELLKVSATSELYVEALLLQADAYQMLSWPEVSLVKLMEARSLVPHEPIVQYGIAELRFGQGDFLETIPLYEELLKKADLDAELLAIAEDHYRYALAAIGEFEAAIALLEDIAVNDRTNEQQNELAFYYAEISEFEKANTIYETLYDEGQISADMLAAYAKVRTQFYDYEGALVLLDEAIELNPFAAKLLVEQAELLTQTGNYQAAINALDTALALDPEYHLAQMNQLHLYLRMENYDQAKRLVTQMEAAGIEDPNFYWLAAQFHHANEDFQLARQAYQQAFQNLDFNEQFIIDYLTFLREEGNWQSAQAVVDKYPLIKEQSDFSEILESFPDDFNFEDF